MWKRVFKTARIAWNGPINYHQPSQTIIATKCRVQSYIMLTQPLRFGSLVADVLLLKRGQFTLVHSGEMTPTIEWLTNWWFQVSPPLKNISQIGLLFPTLGENKKMFQSTNQLILIEWIECLPQHCINWWPDDLYGWTHSCSSEKNISSHLIYVDLGVQDQQSQPDSFCTFSNFMSCMSLSKLLAALAVGVSPTLQKSSKSGNFWEYVGIPSERFQKNGNGKSPMY